MFGSLGVVFPTVHEGGSLIIRHNGKEWTFDSSKAVNTESTPTQLSSPSSVTSNMKSPPSPLGFVRRLDKVCQYASGIFPHLIQKAKRIFPIPQVTDFFSGTGESIFDLCDSAYDAVLRGVGSPSLSPATVDERFPSIFTVTNWQSQWA
jgi:hypothetical protein